MYLAKGSVIDLSTVMAHFMASKVLFDFLPSE